MSVMVEDPLIPALEAFQRGEWPHDPLIDRLKILTAKIERAKRYRELRREHAAEHYWTAKMCWEESGRVYEWDWTTISEDVGPSSDGMETRFEQDGFVVRVRFVADDEPLATGCFTDDCVEPLFLIQRCHPDERASGHYAYFEPESGCTLEDVRFHQLGRHESWVQARRTLLDDVKRGALLGDEFASWGCVVTVFKNGVELTETACWGIDFNSDNPWTIAWEHEAESYAKGDFVPEAIYQAHDKLKELTT